MLAAAVIVVIVNYYYYFMKSFYEITWPVSGRARAPVLNSLFLVVSSMGHKVI